MGHKQIGQNVREQERDIFMGQPGGVHGMFAIEIWSCPAKVLMYVYCFLLFPRYGTPRSERPQMTRKRGKWDPASFRKTLQLPNPATHLGDGNKSTLSHSFGGRS